MTRFFSVFVPLLVAGAAVYALRAPLWVFSHQALREVAPCAIPVTYGIGYIDPRFGVSTSSLERAAQLATGVWEAEAGKNLFEFVQEGTPVVEVSLRYDIRQETTDTLKDLGSEISDAMARYESLEAQYDAMRADFLEQRAAFEADSAAFERDADAYESDVRSWNARGGAPHAVVAALNARKAQLQERQTALESRQRAVNSLADETNELGQRLNALGRNVNVNARTYNEVGAQTGEEFEEGVYESRAGKEDITVFEFDSQERLVRLLAHEFGHALGLDHVENSASIMYRLNKSSNIDPTAEDAEELFAVCGS